MNWKRMIIFDIGIWVFIFISTLFTGKCTLLFAIACLKIELTLVNELMRGYDDNNHKMP